MNSDFITLIPLETFDSGDITANYQVVNAAGFPGSLRYIRIQSTMDEPLFISFDGQYAHEYMMDYDFIDLNAQECSVPSNGRSVFKNKTKVYVRAVDVLPKGGMLYISGFYQT